MKSKIMGSDTIDFEIIITALLPFVFD